MTLETLIVWLIVGGIAGWLAGLLMKSSALRLTGNNLADTIITGLIGAVVGGWLLGALQVPLGGGILAAIISAMIGAVVFLFGLSLIKK